MKPPIIVEGQQFKSLTAIRFESKTAKYQQRWLFRCVCGEEKIARVDHVRRGLIISCGCFQEQSRITHGSSDSPEYACWEGLIARCERPTATGYENYGGRGISVFPEWRQSFPAFLAAVGLRPSALHTIDRINNNGNYEPGNVRWATRKQQQRNRRVNKVTEVIAAQIRALRTEGYLQKVIAEQFSIHPAHVSRICTNSAWEAY
jgi:hypothetical protein